MITRIGAFKTSNGKTFDTLEAAQQEELAIILTDGDRCPNDTAVKLCAKLVEAADKVMDILSTTPTSKPRARKVNGGSKKRKVDAANATMNATMNAAVNRELQDAKQ